MIDRYDGKINEFLSLLSGRRKARMKLISYLPKDSIGIELGTWKGDFTKELALKLIPKLLYTIDIWNYDTKGMYEVKDQKGMDEIYEKVKKDLDRFLNIKVIRSLTSNAVKSFKNNSVDWIYVDAGHNYQSVKNDLKSYFPKVKIGGFICGDDYTDERIRKAVDEFIKEYPVRIIKIIKSQYILIKMENGN